MNPALFRRRRRASDLLLDLRPGHLPGLAWSSTPAAGRYQRNASGVWVDAGSGAARDSHYINGVRTWLVEGQRTNLLTENRYLATWSVSGSPVRTAGQSDPFGASGGYLGEDDDAGAAEAWWRGVTFGSSGEKAAFGVIKKGTAGASMLGLYDASVGTWRHRVLVTWDGSGVPTVTMQVGAGTIYPSVSLANGYWRIHFSATGVIHTNENRIYYYPTTFSVAETGTGYFAGAQVEDAPFCNSFIPTAAGTVGRNAESPYVPWPHAPQEMTVYCRFIEQGTILTSGARLFNLGALGDAGTRAYVREFGGKYGFFYFNGASGSGLTAGTAPSLGDTVELLCYIAPTGNARLSQSINEGAAVVASPDASTPGIASAWATNVLNLNSTGGSLYGFTALRNVIVARGIRTMAEMRARAA